MDANTYALYNINILFLFLRNYFNLQNNTNKLLPKFYV